MNNALLLKEKVLELIRIRGPQLPVQIATQLKINSTFAGAFLSELIADGKVKYTTLKVGGSPLYYVPGHELRLQSYTKHLGQREKEAYDVLEQEKLVKDDDLSPVLRVAMRAITDFAVPLRVTTEQESTIFWKWYLVSEQEVHPLLEKKLGMQKAEPAQPQQLSLFDVGVKEEGIPEEKEKRKEWQKEETKEEKREWLKEEKIGEKTGEKLLIKKKEKKERVEHDVLPVLFSYLQEKNIQVLSHVAKNAEVECVVKVPTPLGEISYFCIAKKKKRCTEAELSAGYLKAQAKGLPFLFLVPHELSKKLHDFVATHMPQVVIRTYGNKNL